MHHYDPSHLRKKSDDIGTTTAIAKVSLEPDNIPHPPKMTAPNPPTPPIQPHLNKHQTKTKLKIQRFEKTLIISPLSSCLERERVCV